MAVSRDRLSREDSIIASYSQRRVSRNIGRGNPIPFVLVDDNEEGMNARTPFRWRDTTMAGNAGSPRFTPQNLSYLVGSGRSRVGGFGTTSIRRFGRLAGPENLGSSRGRGGALPAWHLKEEEESNEEVAKAYKQQLVPRSIGKVPKILLDITHQEGGDAAACLTPQKKLLNSIDVVERVVMEELQKMKRTPSAKRAERERRVRTLMSMR
ncbi:hypothetical protein SASPL_140995 [Salvia splendens]|uniref:Protein POLYCHOME n=1 Tax=Salvia splendens TaxID=180675 RepID=A0A8X8WRP4_SALSN|nr:hypothetical protein SASPL_140995 [Salvia splendens]